MTGWISGPRGAAHRCPATARALAHLGSDGGRRWLSEMAGPPSSCHQAVAWRLRHPGAERPSPATPGSPLDLIVGGSLEDASCSSDFILHLAMEVGKCQNTLHSTGEGAVPVA